MYGWAVCTSALQQLANQCILLTCAFHVIQAINCQGGSEQPQDDCTIEMTAKKYLASMQSCCKQKVRTASAGSS